MKNSKLSDHKLKKGKFITPLNSIDKFTPMKKEKSWSYGRFAEYIWIGLIIDKFGRKEGIQKCIKIIENITKFNLPNIKLSTFISQPDSKREEIYSTIKQSGEFLSPLTLILTYSYDKLFTKYFMNTSEDRLNALTAVIENAFDHQSYLATDIRFIILLYYMMTDRLKMPSQIATKILQYMELEHSDEKMRSIRPMVRSNELTFCFEEQNPISEYFWRTMSQLTDCKTYYIKYNTENEDMEAYKIFLYETIKYYTNLSELSNPINDKMIVLIGITTYSYKRVCEVIEHNLANTISGRNATRVLIENLIMMKYLIKNEANHDNIWLDYQLYGIGQYKLIVKKKEETTLDLPNSHVNFNYMKLLINEFIIEETIDMDTTYFDRQNIRKKAEFVAEKELYDFYYDYDSAFEHGLWGAIRESSLLKCDSAGHHYHCIPDYHNQQNLPSVWHDCKMIMNKTIRVLSNTYELPKSLLDELAKHEI